jgi:hypothetical protein
MERRDGKSQHNPRPDPVQKMEMMQIIWERKREWATDAEIAEELGISKKTVWKYFHEYELFLVPPSVEQERLLHIQQIQDMMAELGQMKARYKEPEVLLKIMAELRALMKDYRRFMDMEGPKRHAHTVQSEFDAEFGKLEDEFADFRDRAEREATKERDERRGRFQR